jgi:hypothetical protein
MPSRGSIASPVRRALLAATGAFLLASLVPARAHIIPVIDLLHGIRITQAQCAAIPSTVWVNVSGRDYCMRYYLSTAGGEGSRPLVFLQGDRLGRLNTRTGEFSPGPREKDLDTDHFVRYADSLSRQAKTTAIYLARVGIDGSSGDHRVRHSVQELNVTQAALDAIKQRHKFEGFHLVGQSGGSKLVGGLIALRADIGCAVIGAGRLVDPRPPGYRNNLGVEYFNVADAVKVIAQRRTTRILMVTDPADRKVPDHTQSPFVQLVRQAGGQVEQFIVQATDEDHHGVAGYSRAAAADCIRGASNQDIAQNLRRLVERRLAVKAQRDHNPGAPIAPVAQPNPPAPAPVALEPARPDAPVLGGTRPAPVGPTATIERETAGMGSGGGEIDPGKATEGRSTTPAL